MMNLYMIPCVAMEALLLELTSSTDRACEEKVASSWEEFQSDSMLLLGYIDASVEDRIHSIDEKEEEELLVADYRS